MSSVPGCFSREEVKRIFEEKSDPNKFWILSGKAGSGKTFVLEKISNKILYPIHIGRLVENHVYTQLVFEAVLSKELLEKPLRFIVEDKGRKYGHLSLPEKLLRSWDKAAHFVLEAPLEVRIENILNSHVTLADKNKTQLEYLIRLKDRIGEKLFLKLYSICLNAYLDNDIELHKEWIRLLIIEYFDPQFDYYFHYKKPLVIGRGNKEEIQAMLLSESQKLLSRLAQAPILP